jgi:spore coat polysaccharide biosynthesis protein SpsF
VQSADEAEDALADADVQHIQMPFNILDWRWDRVLSLCATRPDVTVHVRSVFLQGLLAADNPALWPSIEQVDAKDVVTKISALVRDLHRDSAADLCLAYARGQGEIDGLVVGLETEAQLEANLALFAKSPLSAADCARVKAFLPRLPEQLLNPALWPKK